MKKLIGVLAIAILFGCNSEEKKSEGNQANNEEPKKQEKIIPADLELGDYSFVEIGVKNTFDESKSFYETMGFKVIPDQFEDTAMIMMSDNSLKIVLNKGSIAPAMLVYLNKDLNGLKAKLKEQGVLFSEPGDYVQIKSPNGARVAVLNMDSEGKYQTTAPNMMGLMETGQIGNPGALPNPVIGVFGEFSHQVRDVEAAMKWWAKLGLMGSGIMEYGYKFAILMDKYSVVGVHEKQDDKWIGSAITYFATDQDARLARLKEVLPATMINESAKLGPGSAIVKTPEGNLFFVFKL